MIVHTRASKPVLFHIPSALGNATAIAAGVFLALHGIAHSLAFFTQWQLTHTRGIAYTTTLFYGKIDVGTTGIRVDGLLWLAAAVAFVVVGASLAWFRKLQVIPLAAVTLFSLALCVLGLPQAIVGVWIDGAILVALALVFLLTDRRAA